RAGLGNNVKPGRARGLFMLLIKGDLLVRYPNALIYAVRARWSRNASGQDVAPPVVDDGQTSALPVLRLSPSPGVLLLGFALTVNNVPVTSDAIGGVAAPPGDPGWFFIIEEHPTEARFGLDLSRDPGALTTWRELSWPDVALRADGSG